MKVSLSVVIPAFNEERRLPGTLAVILPFLRGRPGTFEVLVVDDGSTDRTPEVARQAGAEVRVRQIAQSRHQRHHVLGVVRRRQRMGCEAGEEKRFPGRLVLGTQNRPAHIVCRRQVFLAVDTILHATDDAGNCDHTPEPGSGKPPPEFFVVEK